MGNIRLVALGLALAPLAACMAAPLPEKAPAPGAGDTCRAEPGQVYLGQVASQALAIDLLVATSSREVRWVPPGTMVTMDYRFGRLTVGYDEAMRITSVTCS
jgi:hypothetical protein